MSLSLLSALCLIGAVLAQRTPTSNETHFICEGEVYAKEKFTEPNMKCCGSNLFDPNTKFCLVKYGESSAKLEYSLKDAKNNHSNICGDEVYDAETDVCCSGQVVAKKPHLLYDLYPRCCKMEQYDVEKHVCCKSTGKLLELPTRGASDVYVRTECCGEELFTNFSYQACCSDKVIDRPPQGRSYCCGAELLTDVTQQLCCNGVVHDRSQNKGMECCNNFSQNENDDNSLAGLMYNKTTQTCCMGHVYDAGKVTECSKFHIVEDSAK